jgi:hypothetical protein
MYMYVCTVGFVILTAVVMKSSTSWDITPCSPLKVSDVSEEHVAPIFRVEESAMITTCFMFFFFSLFSDPGN